MTVLQTKLGMTRRRGRRNMSVLQTKLGMTRRERRNMTVLQTKLGMRRKEEHDSVADKARNDEERGT